MKSVVGVYSRELLLVALMLAIAAAVTVASPVFLTWGNLANLLRSNAVNGIMAMGMMLVIVTGNIDISIGSGIVVSGGVAAVLAQALPKDVNPLVGVLLCFLVSTATGVAIGLINGFFVSWLHIPSIIVTLSTMSILRGLICVITKGQWITGLPKWFITMANRNIGGVYIGVFIWGGVIFVTWALVNWTNFGRKILATGGNPSAAERVGIRTRRIGLFVFAFIGATVGLAGVVFVSQTGMLDPMVGSGYEMTLIAAVVIGGASLSGGRASILGTVLGMLLLSLIDNALVIAGLPVYFQKFVTGVLILLAVVASALRAANRFADTAGSWATAK
jgi:ribose/xylose/arabinose/galactoside ABC-type transport system permease subunit